MQEGLDLNRRRADYESQAVASGLSYGQEGRTATGGSPQPPRGTAPFATRDGLDLCFSCRRTVGVGGRSAHDAPQRGGQTARIFCSWRSGPAARIATSSWSQLAGDDLGRLETVSGVRRDLLTVSDPHRLPRSSVPGSRFANIFSVWCQSVPAFEALRLSSVKEDGERRPPLMPVTEMVVQQRLGASSLGIVVAVPARFVHKCEEAVRKAERRIWAHARSP